MKTDSFTEISRNDLNCFLVRLNGMSFSLSHSLTQMSIVSSKGIFVNNDFTSKLAKKNESENSADCNSLANSMEFLTVKAFCVNGCNIGTKNLAQL